jgi:hypothetical protein
LKIALGNMLSTNPERAVSCALFCKSIFTKPLIFESTLSVITMILITNSHLPKHSQTFAIVAMRQHTVLTLNS